MSEIEKMMQNADIKPDCTYLFLVDGNGENEAARTISIGSKADLKRLIVDCGVKGKVIKSTNTLKPFYPPFTAEKQIELIKLLAKGEIKIDNTDGEYEFSIFDTISDFNSFEESLAEVINKLWTDMSQEEKQQIKEILSE